MGIKFLKCFKVYRRCRGRYRRRQRPRNCRRKTSILWRPSHPRRGNAAAGAVVNTNESVKSKTKMMLVEQPLIKSNDTPVPLLPDAFYPCSSLLSVSFVDDNTLETIGNSNSACPATGSPPVLIPKSVTTIGSSKLVVVLPLYILYIICLYVCMYVCMHACMYSYLYPFLLSLVVCTFSIF